MGLKVEMLSGVVRDGFADIPPRTMRAGGGAAPEVRLTITDGGMMRLDSLLSQIAGFISGFDRAKVVPARPVSKRLP